MMLAEGRIADAQAAADEALARMAESAELLYLRGQVAMKRSLWGEAISYFLRAEERCITVTAQFANGVYAAPVEHHVVEIMQNEIEIPEGIRSEVGGHLGLPPYFSITNSCLVYQLLPPKVFKALRHRLSNN